MRMMCGTQAMGSTGLMTVGPPQRADPEANDGREGRPDAGNATLAFERFHQCRLFADLIGSGAGVPVAIELLAAAEDVLAQEALGVGVGEGLAHDVDQVAIFAANVD